MEEWKSVTVYFAKLAVAFAGRGLGILLFRIVDADK